MSFNQVFFDCDSTLSRVEGIDELGRRAGVFERVADLTNQAMNGEITLEEVYARRLQLIKPGQEDIDWLARHYIDEMVEGAAETLAELKKHGKDVHIISGGLRQAILPMAEVLNVAEDHLHAVDIQFDRQGQYAGFDDNSPLARSGGKAEICRQIVAHADTAVLVGDGKTDLEAKQAGVTVIGFGGVVARDAVREQADYFVDEPTLRAVLAFLI